MTAEQPAWLDEAWPEVGTREVKGSASNERILQFYRDVGHASVTSDEVAWCAAFVGACLERVGYASTRSLLARSYLDWGAALDGPKLGAVAVLSRGNDPGQGHVGFVVGVSGNQLILLGGNQDDAVTVQAFDASRLLGLRWPSETTSAIVQSDAGEMFESALAHVLAMEGGWSDDPVDPGGPTNRGITLAVYAAAKGMALTDANRITLIKELKEIDSAFLTEIYRSRYWQPARAAEMPPALALMHFDAAVNHGVGNAARMLQEAARVEIDGEIGPQTMAAVMTLPEMDFVARYADIRRARYRSLGHFWRFGRGWLKRVDLTLAAAERIGTDLAGGVASRPQSEITQSQTGDIPMTTTDDSEATNKWWAHSMTIWGAIITAASTVLPVLGPLIGLDITSDLVRELGDGVVAVVQAVGGLIGIAMTVVGRSRASSTLERRRVTLQL